MTDEQNNTENELLNYQKKLEEKKLEEIAELYKKEYNFNLSCGVVEKFYEYLNEIGLYDFLLFPEPVPNHRTEAELLKFVSEHNKTIENALNKNLTKLEPVIKIITGLDNVSSKECKIIFRRYLSLII